jgi:hypothetical protein
MEVGAFSNDYVESRGSKKLREKVHRLISKVDLLAATLEGRRREIKETVADPALTGSIESKKYAWKAIKRLIIILIFKGTSGAHQGFDWIIRKTSASDGRCQKN